MWISVQWEVILLLCVYNTDLNKIRALIIVGTGILELDYHFLVAPWSSVSCATASCMMIIDMSVRATVYVGLYVSGGIDNIIYGRGKCPERREIQAIHTTDLSQSVPVLMCS